MNTDSIEYAEAWTATVYPTAPANVIAFPAPASNCEIENCAQCARNATPALMPSDLERIRNVVDQGRNAVIKAIKYALQQRSGKQWSVTGGRGTAWGWITVDAPPSRRTMRCRLKAGAVTTNPDDYEMYDSGEAGHSTRPEDIDELSALLGIEKVHCQGYSIPAGRDYQRLALCQALHGHSGPFTAQPYWD